MTLKEKRQYIDTTLEKDIPKKLFVLKTLCKVINHKVKCSEFRIYEENNINPLTPTIIARSGSYASHDSGRKLFSEYLEKICTTLGTSVSITLAPVVVEVTYTGLTENYSDEDFESHLGEALSTGEVARWLAYC